MILIQLSEDLSLVGIKAFLMETSSSTFQGVCFLQLILLCMAYKLK